MVKGGRWPAQRTLEGCGGSPAATVIARNPKVTLRELMAAIGHWSPVAALRHQHATAEWSKAIASYLDDVIELARSAHESARIPRRL